MRLSLQSQLKGLNMQWYALKSDLGNFQHGTNITLKTQGQRGFLIQSIMRTFFLECQCRSAMISSKGFSQGKQPHPETKGCYCSPRYHATDVKPQFCPTQLTRNISHYC